MPTPQVQNDPIVNLGISYINGLIVSNNATTPNTKLDISAGMARDSNNIMDITLGSANPNLEGATTDSPLVINAAVNGANGLDTGSLAASLVYAVYIIGDSRYYSETAAILTLASNSAPLMPTGYDSYRLIGYAVTDSSVHFLKAYITGNASGRLFVYDAPIATAITAGASTTYAAANLITFVPNVNNLPVILNTAFTPGAASRTLNLQPGNATGDAITVTGQVTAVIVTTQSTVLSQPTVISTVSSPTVNYKVSNSGDAVAIKVAGFQFYL